MGGTREIILDFCHGSCHLKRIPDFLAASGVRSFFALCARVPSSGREASIIYYITELVDRGLAAGRFAYTAYRAATSPARSPSGLLFPP